MTTRALLAVALLASAVAPNVQAQPQAPQTVPAPLPSVTLPTELDRVLRDYERAWAASDAGALAALFTEDGFVLQPNRPPVRGRAQLEERYRGQGGGALRLRALAFATDGDVGWIIGAYGYGDAPPDAQGDRGKFTLTLRRGADGRWLIASDMDNGNQPPRRPPA